MTTPRWTVPLTLVLLCAGCNLPRCDELCQREADCVEQTLLDNRSSWEEWTGFADRDAYVDACFGVFSDSRDGGAKRSDLRHTCKAELAKDTCGS